MPDCVGYVTPYFKRDGESKAKSQACKVTIASPSPSWVQLTATLDDKAIRLSIEMEEFEKLASAVDNLTSIWNGDINCASTSLESYLRIFRTTLE